jgi:hypothetical protein
MRLFRNLMGRIILIFVGADIVLARKRMGWI